MSSPLNVALYHREEVKLRLGYIPGNNVYLIRIQKGPAFSDMLQYPGTNEKGLGDERRHAQGALAPLTAEAAHTMLLTDYVGMLTPNTQKARPGLRYYDD